MLPTTLFSLSALASFATITPVFLISWAAGETETHCITYRKSPKEKRTNMMPRLTNISRLSSWSRAHVQYKFSLLWRKSHDWQKTGGSLQHVLARQVLWSCACVKATREVTVHETHVGHRCSVMQMSKQGVRLLNGKRIVMTYWD